MAINHFEYHARLVRILRERSQKLPAAWHQQSAPAWMSSIIAACNALENEIKQAKRCDSCAPDGKSCDPAKLFRAG